MRRVPYRCDLLLGFWGRAFRSACELRQRLDLRLRSDGTFGVDDDLEQGKERSAVEGAKNSHGRKRAGALALAGRKAKYDRPLPTACNAATSHGQCASYETNTSRRVYRVLRPAACRPDPDDAPGGEVVPMGEEYQAYARHTAALARSLCAHVELQYRSGARRSHRLGRAGHVAWLSMRESHGRIARVFAWQGAWWLRIARYAAATGSVEPCRLKSGHRRLGERLWDNLVQRAAELHSGEPWQSVAQDRAEWHHLESGFIARVLHSGSTSRPAHAPPPTRESASIGIREFGRHAHMRAAISSLNKRT